MMSMVQTDCAVSGGASGGALVTVTDSVHLSVNAPGTAIAANTRLRGINARSDCESADIAARVTVGTGAFAGLITSNCVHTLNPPLPWEAAAALAASAPQAQPTAASSSCASSTATSGAREAVREHCRESSNAGAGEVELDFDAVEAILNTANNYKANNGKVSPATKNITNNDDSALSPVALRLRRGSRLQGDRCGLADCTKRVSGAACDGACDARLATTAALRDVALAAAQGRGSGLLHATLTAPPFADSVRDGGVDAAALCPVAQPATTLLPHLNFALPPPLLAPAVLALLAAPFPRALLPHALAALRLAARDALRHAAAAAAQESSPGDMGLTLGALVRQASFAAVLRAVTGLESSDFGLSATRTSASATGAGVYLRWLLTPLPDEQPIITNNAPATASAASPTMTLANASEDTAAVSVSAMLLAPPTAAHSGPPSAALAWLLPRLCPKSQARRVLLPSHLWLLLLDLPSPLLSALWALEDVADTADPLAAVADSALYTDASTSTGATGIAAAIAADDAADARWAARVRDMRARKTHAYAVLVTDTQPQPEPQSQMQLPSDGVDGNSSDAPPRWSHAWQWRPQWAAQDAARDMVPFSAHAVRDIARARTQLEALEAARAATGATAAPGTGAEVL